MLAVKNILPRAINLSKICRQTASDYLSTKICPFVSTGVKTQVASAFSLSKIIDKFNPLEKYRNSLIFAPSKKSYLILESDRKNLEELFIDTPDGAKLHGYFMPAKEKTNKTVIFLHGNDLNINRWYLAPMNLQEHVPVNFLIVDYRGYGKSTGQPSAKGVITDALAMYKYLINKGYKSDDISVYGRSLGGAVALELASRANVRSAVVQSSFITFRDLIKAHKPSIYSLLFKKNLFNSKKNIQKVNTPILISHGTEDKLIPLSHAYELYENANEPKKLIVLNGAGHEHLKEFYTEEYFKALREMFL